MTQRTGRPLHVAGLIERHDNHVLIVLPAPDTGLSRQWQFPRGPAAAGESAETAMRRVAEERLGIGVEIVVGQPPVAATVDGCDIELRYFICGMAWGEARAGGYAEIRWVPRFQLREYEFDGPSREAALWFVEG